MYHSKLGDVLPTVLPIRRRGERKNPTNLRERYQADALIPSTSIQANPPLAPIIKRKHSSMNNNNAAPISMAGQLLSHVPHQTAEQALQDLDDNMGDPRGEYLDASSSHRNRMTKGKIMVGKEISEVIANWLHDAKSLLDMPMLASTQELEDILRTGRGFNVDMPELEKLESTLRQMKWSDRAREAHGQYLTLQDIVSMIEDGEKLGIAESNYFLVHFGKQKEAGEAWETKAKELMAGETLHYLQLEALRNQAKAAILPVPAETLTAVDQVLDKYRETHRHILLLYKCSKDPDFTKRPTYTELRDTMEGLVELNCKLNGTLDLEMEQKRHEDWMRKGKKLFGKANAPLHILKSHMEYVLERNLDCFDINTDKPRTPAVPRSREPSPADGKLYSRGDPRFQGVFCICRRAEAGMLIECDFCHEW
jgi:[histone H3]-trimethyl-L-lysine4 demethylase